LHALSLATLSVVALALGVLQYRWIDEVSQAQETRERSRLREEVRLIADALDTEITRAALVFTVPVLPGTARTTPHQLNAPARRPGSPIAGCVTSVRASPSSLR
jgi:hypothetical protein